MAMKEIDLEKQPFITTTEVTNPTSPVDSKKSAAALFVYQTLVGDVTAKPSRTDPSLFHEISSRQRKAQFTYILAAFGFGIAVALQIILCLGIAIGAQLGLTMNDITLLAGVNTGVAASIGIMKSLGLPEKPAIEKYKLKKVADRIRFTTRRIKAGLVVDAEKEAEAARHAEEDAEDEAQIIQHVGDAGAAIPASLSSAGHKDAHE
ncbi:hypothetical protein BAUCODRAFT_294510 [Baudoinia panamericana UAMH 10762]|uniref:SMODS and SLOG-associating 2TM effector domain-containing protein n=1 Tax=Baudoinia panamericana (strain UAMH 10762) TaxID=717646 RepID=M2LEV0_BAUPA|nr:uncharacterized protein BAUCODRAFT_294510 [Baudoinia panamericana UAMH 10762]EMC92527.1 hypothetical protein BAUCODRAFT_294510 [Baudoinia panamericana UAMH 10762]